MPLGRGQARQIFWDKSAAMNKPAFPFWNFNLAGYLIVAMGLLVGFIFLGNALLPHPTDLAKALWIECSALVLALFCLAYTSGTEDWNQGLNVRGEVRLAILWYVGIITFFFSVVLTHLV